MNTDTYSYIRVLRALSNSLILLEYLRGVSTISLGNLCQYLTDLIIKNKQTNKKTQPFTYIKSKSFSIVLSEQILLKSLSTSVL